ncbi:hypothetical protein I2750_12385 [Bacillus sp. PR5]|nr:hypothetical protein [Bacillus sp. PR5]
MTRPAVPALLSPRVSGHAHLSFRPIPTGVAPSVSGQSTNAGADRPTLLWGAAVSHADPMLARYLPPYS